MRSRWLDEVSPSRFARVVLTVHDDVIGDAQVRLHQGGLLLAALCPAAPRPSLRVGLHHEGLLTLSPPLLLQQRPLWCKQVTNERKTARMRDLRRSSRLIGLTSNNLHYFFLLFLFSKAQNTDPSISQDLTNPQPHPAGCSPPLMQAH